MRKGMTFSEVSDKYVCLLIVFAALFVADCTIAGFPLYGFLLLLIAIAWMMSKILFGQREGIPFLQIQNMTDIAAMAAIICSVLSIALKLFQNPEEGAIDIAGNTEVLACAILYFLLSSGINFRTFYFDCILYAGLLLTGIFIFPYFTGTQVINLAEPVFADSGAAASFLLLFCMIGSFRYCTCKDDMRLWFYGLSSAVGFLALLLNRNVLSFWFMSAYFLVIPVWFRPTAQLVKRDMQLFFLFGFMLSNMSLLTGYTDILQKELAYSLEHSVYLELLLAAGGIFFFRGWEKIPEGIDLERLVLRKMRRGYQFACRLFVIFFAGILAGGERWETLADGMAGKIWKSFARPLILSVKEQESGFYFCFENLGVTAGIFAVIFCALLIGRLWKNYGLDKPVTGSLILISGFFLLQLLFWQPAVNTFTLYLLLLIPAAFYKEDKMKVISTKVRKEALMEQRFCQE